MLYLRMAKNRRPTRRPKGQTPGEYATPATRSASGAQIDAVYQQVREILEHARATVARSVNTEMVRAYWLIGREVVEEEQKGSTRAGYGDELIDHLSARLRAEYGRGFTPSNLRYMRLFYLAYPNLLGREIRHAVRDKSARMTDHAGIPKPRGGGPPVGVLNPDLSWTHYRVLTKVESPPARDSYEIEAARNHGSSRELERQINTLLFERLAKSRDKKGLMRLALKGQEIQSACHYFRARDGFRVRYLPEPPAYQCRRIG
jgi:hypothetical protein